MLLGNKNIEPDGDTNDAGSAEAFPFSGRVTGKADAIRVYVDAQSAARTLIVGLYTDAGGHPGSEMTSGTLNTPQAGAWNTVPVSAAAVRASGRYWLVILGEHGTVRLRDRFGGSCTSLNSARTNLSALPGSWRTGQQWQTCPVSAYVTGPPTATVASTGGGSTGASLTTTTPPTTIADGGSTLAPPPPVELPAPPATSAPPVVSGVAVVGQTLTTSTGSWSDAPTSYSYSWQDCNSSGSSCTTISGATAASYTLGSADVGRTIRSVITATNSGGSTSADSAATAAVTSATNPQPPTNTAVPVVSGSAQQGQTLATTNGSWSNAPTSYSYTWEDCSTSGTSCTTIPGATSTTYTPTSSDVDHTIRSLVTAANSAGPSSATSSPTTVVGGASSGCTVTASSASAVASDVSSAADGAVICVAAGNYAGFTLTRTGSHSANVTVEPVVGTDPNGAGKVTIGIGATDSNTHQDAVDFRPGTNHVTLHGFYVTDTINVEPGASQISVDHNDISGGGGYFGEGINVGSVDCTAPHAPSYSGCQSVSPVTYLTISGNRIHGFGSGTEDAIHLNNWQHVHVTGNDLYSLEESGNHTDNLQSVWGGADITFDHNYEHDSQAQGFFLSNGDIVGATVTDNLMVRQNNKGMGEVQIQIGNTHNVVVENNTVWADSGSNAVRAYDGAPTSCNSDPYCSTSAYDATVDHNVLETVTNYQAGDPAHVNMTESMNLFKQSPTQFSANSSDSVSSSPAFACGSSCGNGTAAGDDYELANNPSGIGIDWSPANQQYGP